MMWGVFKEIERHVNFTKEDKRLPPPSLLSLIQEMSKIAKNRAHAGERKSRAWIAKEGAQLGLRCQTTLASPKAVNTTASQPSWRQFLQRQNQRLSSERMHVGNDNSLHKG